MNKKYEETDDQADFSFVFGALLRCYAGGRMTRKIIFVMNQKNIFIVHPNAASQASARDPRHARRIDPAGGLHGRDGGFWVANERAAGPSCVR
jgi:hypothetical protein